MLRYLHKAYHIGLLRILLCFTVLCDVLDKFSVTSQLIEAFMENAFRCEECDRMFSAKRALQRHLKENRRHRKEATGSSATFSKIRCKRCAKTFVRPYDYRRHIAEQHGHGKRPCPRCGRAILRLCTPNLNDQGVAWFRAKGSL